MATQALPSPEEAVAEQAADLAAQLGDDRARRVAAFRADRWAQSARHAADRSPEQAEQYGRRSVAWRAFAGAAS
ncbi:hypothetical protein F0L68_40590, partial [Solihabitans fulvus]